MPAQHVKELLSDSIRDLRDDRVPELAVRLRVGHDDGLFVEPHEALALYGREPSRVLAVLRDQNLGAVLVVAGAQRARDAVGVSQSEPEAVALRFVVPRVFLEVVPEMARQRVLRVRVLLHDVLELAGAARRLRERERRILAENEFVEARDVHALPVLGHPCGRVDDLVEHGIAEFLQGVLYRPPGPPLLVGLEVLDVLKEHDGRALYLHDRGDVEEQRPLRGALEAVGLP